jgi:hypothetical protein
VTGVLAALMPSGNIAEAHITVQQTQQAVFPLNFLACLTAIWL